MAREAEPRNGRRWEGIGDRVQAITEAVHESRYTGNVFRSLWSASQPKKRLSLPKPWIKYTADRMQITKQTSRQDNGRERKAGEGSLYCTIVVSTILLVFRPPP